MKILFSTLITLCCSYAALAQNNGVSPNGSGNGNGNAYSNGNIPSQYEQNQNRPDSTLRSDDTTYMHQQWNAESTQNNNSSKKKSTGKTTATKSTTTKPKKKK